MVITIPNHQLHELETRLAEGYRQFGVVKPRREYPPDEDQGGVGGSGLLMFESHPLLSHLPEGADPDLTGIATDYDGALDALQERELETCPRLRYQLELQKQKRFQFNPKPMPS